MTPSKLQNYGFLAPVAITNSWERERDKTGGVRGMAGRRWISMAELVSEILTWFTLLCS